MSHLRRPRDIELIDAIDSLGRRTFDGEVWRVVSKDRDPLVGFPSGGRWDPGEFDVLYCSLQKSAAIAEIHYHLSQLPIFPSKEFVVHQISVNIKDVLEFESLEMLTGLGVAADRYDELLYERTQEIGDVVAFLGFEGLIAPSARFDAKNLVLFTDRVEPAALEVKASEPVDWVKWRETHK